MPKSKRVKTVSNKESVPPYAFDRLSVEEFCNTAQAFSNCIWEKYKELKEKEGMLTRGLISAIYWAKLEEALFDLVGLLIEKYPDYYKEEIIKTWKIKRKDSREHSNVFWNEFIALLEKSREARNI
jgi:hypothetical protein